MTPAEWRKWVQRNIGQQAEDFGAGDLQFLADGPICNPLRIFCPAGRLSWTEYNRRREQQVF